MEGVRSGRQVSVGGGRVWEVGECGRRESVGGGRLWEEGECGR